MTYESGPYRTTCTTVTSLVDICTSLLGSRELAVATIARGGAWVNRERVRSLSANLLPSMQVTVHTPPAHARPCLIPRPLVDCHQQTGWHICRFNTMGRR
jgi:hypothetical protein